MKISKKTLFTTLFLFILFTGLFAQTSPGNLLLGGTSDLSFGITLSSIKSDNISDDNGTRIHANINPLIGVFVAPGLAIGGSIPLGYSQLNRDLLTTTSYHAGITPFVRYYIGKAKVKPFVGIYGGAQYMVSKYDDTMTIANNERLSTMFGFRGGAAFFVGDHAALELGLRFGTNRSKSLINNSTNLVNIDTGFSLFGGVAIFIGN